ncbi:MAG TPA: hypothetical protein PLX06_03590 [Fimbriimonadaceae bacterium]|nr:hypothetical protein [Fimbriimonadaceae bacterium]
MQARPQLVDSNSEVEAMPTNKIIYFGVIIIAASALLWLGAQIAKQAEWLLPYTGILGILLIVVGLAMEIKKKKALAFVESASEGQPESKDV